jgi:predicted RNase H-like nuclease (RuvC/YqgF family)
MASTADIVIPLITGLGGGVLGATFTRVTSRNDQRRDKYAAALSAVRALSKLAEGDDRASRLAKETVKAHADWLVIDSKPVGRAYEALAQAAQSDSSNAETVQAARQIYVEAARAYTRWTLHQRVWLHLRGHG